MSDRQLYWYWFSIALMVTVVVLSLIAWGWVNTRRNDDARNERRIEAVRQCRELDNTDRVLCLKLNR